MRTVQVEKGFISFQRLMEEEDWINNHASGTLRKNRRLGMLWHDQYIEERIAWEFGAAWESMPESRILAGPARTESDCHELTEFGWLCDRYISHIHTGSPDLCGVGYIHVDKDGEAREGLAIWLTQTFTVNWIPKHHLVFALVSEYRNGTYQPCRYI